MRARARVRDCTDPTLHDSPNRAMSYPCTLRGWVSRAFTIYTSRSRLLGATRVLGACKLLQFGKNSFLFFSFCNLKSIIAISPTFLNRLNNLYKRWVLRRCLVAFLDSPDCVCIDDVTKSRRCFSFNLSMVIVSYNCYCTECCLSTRRKLTSVYMPMLIHGPITPSSSRVSSLLAAVCLRHRPRWR